MNEEGNCNRYHSVINQNLKNEIPFVPYLGFFLTQVVHHTCHQMMLKSQWLKPSTNNDFICSTEQQYDHSPMGSQDCLNCEIDSDNDGSSSMENEHYLSYELDGDSDLSSQMGSQYQLNVCTSDLRLKSQDHLNYQILADSDSDLSSPMGHQVHLSCQVESVDVLMSVDPMESKDATCFQTNSSNDLFPPVLLLTICPTYSRESSYDSSDRSSYFSSSFGSADSESYIKSPPGNDEIEEFCWLVDSSLYLTKGSINKDSSNEDHVESTCLGNDSGFSTQTSSKSGNVYLDDKEYCMLSDAAHYRTPVVCINSADDHNDTILSPDSAGAHKCCGTESSSHSQHLTIGFSNVPTHLAHANQDSLLKCHEKTQLDSANHMITYYPTALLQKYQYCSLDCSARIKSREKIRDIIMNYHCNTEMDNYMSSYQREPL